MADAMPAASWAVWNYDGARCCGRRSVDVYPAHLEAVQCVCGMWRETPAYDPEGKRIVERGQGIN